VGLSDGSDIVRELDNGDEVGLFELKMGLLGLKLDGPGEEGVMKD
jgi:uncharacterized protein YjiK